MFVLIMLLIGLGIGIGNLPDVQDDTKTEEESVDEVFEKILNETFKYW